MMCFKKFINSDMELSKTSKLIGLKRLRIGSHPTVSLTTKSLQSLLAEAEAVLARDTATMAAEAAEAAALKSQRLPFLQEKAIL